MGFKPRRTFDSLPDSTAATAASMVLPPLFSTALTASSFCGGLPSPGTALTASLRTESELSVRLSRKPLSNFIVLVWMSLPTLAVARLRSSSSVFSFKKCLRQARAAVVKAAARPRLSSASKLLMTSRRK